MYKKFDRKFSLKENCTLYAYCSLSDCVFRIVPNIYDGGFFRKHLKTKIVKFFHCEIFSQTGQWAVGSNPVAIT